MKIRFEWDPVKAAGNLRKHGVSFETALRAFADPWALTHHDRIEDGEQRWQTLGLVEGHLLILVAHTIVDQDEAAQPTEEKGNAMSKNVARHEIDLADLPPLTEQQKSELAALRDRPDSTIDYSDIPPLPEEFWKDAARGRFYKPTKTSTTVRIDSDVLAWLRAQGKGYQSRINAILRREMLSSLKR